MNDNEPTQQLDSATPAAAPAAAHPATPRPFWRRKPVWITAIVVGGIAVGGAGAALAIDEFGDDDRVTVAADADRSGTERSSSDRSADGSERSTRSDVDTRDARDADDVPLTDAEYTDASTAALAEAGGGTVTDVDRSDDPGVAFEVDVLLANGDELEVDLGADYGVVRSVLDPRD